MLVINSGEMVSDYRIVAPFYRASNFVLDPERNSLIFTQDTSVREILAAYWPSEAISMTSTDKPDDTMNITDLISAERSSLMIADSLYQR